MSVVIRKISEKDKEAVAALLTKYWQSAIMAVHGETYDMSQLPGFMAVESGRIVGLATYIETAGSSIEIISLNSFSENRGIGTKLLSAIIQLATEKEAGRLFLTTTNDNMKALDFYPALTGNKTPTSKTSMNSKKDRWEITARKRPIGSTNNQWWMEENFH